MSKNQLPHVQIKELHGTNDAPNSKVLPVLLSSETEAIHGSNSVLKGTLAEKQKGNSKV